MTSPLTWATYYHACVGLFAKVSFINMMCIVGSALTIHIIATNQKEFNIVNNNGYAQVVPHVHWHVSGRLRANTTPFV